MKKNLTTKIISLLLAGLLAVGSFGIALPNLAVFAEAHTNAQVQAVLDAYNTGISHGVGFTYGTDYTVSGANTTGVSIADKTRLGDVYLLLSALEAMAVADGGTNHNSALRSTLKSATGNVGVINTLIDYLIPMPTNNGYNSYTPSSNGSWSYQAYNNADPPDSCGYNGRGGFSMTTTVTRTLSAAVMSTYSDSASVSGTLPLSTSLTISTAVQHNTSVRVSSYTPVQYGWIVIYLENRLRACSYYNYNTGVSSSTGTNTATPDLSAITDYNTCVNSAEFRTGDGTAVAEGIGFDKWKEDYTSTFLLDAQQAENIIDTYTGVYTTDGFLAVDEVYRTFYCSNDEGRTNGLDVTEEYNDYIAAVMALSEALDYRIYLDWIINGDIEDPLYSLTALSHQGIDPRTATAEQRTMLDNLTSVATEYKNILDGVSNEIKAVLSGKLGNDFDAVVYGDTAPSYPALLKEISDIQQKYSLYQIKYEVFTRLGLESDDLAVIDYNGSPVSIIDKIDMVQRSQYGDEAMDDAVLECVEWLRMKYSQILQFSADNRLAVFGEESLNTISDKIGELDAEIIYRDLERTYKVDYGKLAGLSSVSGSSSFATLSGVLEAAETDYAALSAHHTTCLNAVGQEKTDCIFGNSLAEIKAEMDRLYSIIFERSYIQHMNLVIAGYDDDDNPVVYADEVGASNVTRVKRAINKIDNNMYSWIMAHSNGMDTYTLEYIHSQIPKYQTAVNNQLAARWNGWSRVQLDSPAGSGHYTLRCVRDNDVVRYEDANTDDWGDGDDEYEVTEGKINTVIEKVDNFITSSDFTKLLGVYRETEEIDPKTGATLPAITTLEDYLEQYLTDLIFNDNTLNILVSMFPTIATVLTTTLHAMIDGGLGYISATPSDSNADGGISLPAIAPANIAQGVLDLYVDGKWGSNSFVNVLGGLGINIFPSQFAEKLAAANNECSPNYTALINDLRAAGDNWSNFDTNGDGTCNALDFASYKWGVHDYNSFVTALGDVLGSIERLVRMLLTENAYSGTATSFATATAYNVVAYYNQVYILIGGMLANASATIGLTGVRGYDNILVPIFEALGITEATGSYNVTLETPLSSTIGTSGGSASNAQIVNAICMPIRALIHRVASAPLETILDILPNLAMFITYDCIEPMLDTINPFMSIALTPQVYQLLQVTAYVPNPQGGYIPVAAGDYGNAILGIVNTYFQSNPINQYRYTEIGSAIDLKAMLQMDITDINAMLDVFLAGAGDFEFPVIDAGKLACLGEKTVKSSLRTENHSNSLGGGQRYTIVADRADVLYDLLLWVFDFISIDGNMSALMSMFGIGTLDPKINAILTELTPEDALAAVVELFSPQYYNMDVCDWYQSNQDGSEFVFDNTDYSSFVYLKYANDWTQKKSEYVYDNIDYVAESLLEKINPAILMFHGDVNTYLNSLVNGMFTSGGIDTMMNLLTGIGMNLVNNQQLAGLLQRDLDIDIMAWYNSFGYLYDNYGNVIVDLDASGNLQFDADGNILFHTEYPLSPEDEGYVSSFPHITCEKITPLDADGNPYVINGVTLKVNLWSYDGVPLYDTANEDAREIFTNIFADLLTPFAPVLRFMLTGQSLSLFNDALTVNGYECYSSAVIPLCEAFGIFDMMTQSEYTAYASENGDSAAFRYIIDKVFDKITWLMSATHETAADGTEYDYLPLQKIIDTLPNVLYFLQSDGLSAFLKNIIHPLWVLVDTLRPVADFDIDGFIHSFLCAAMGLSYDAEDPQYQTSAFVDALVTMLVPDYTYDAEKAAEDKDIVDAVFSLTIQDLSLETLLSAFEAMFGFDLSPIKYAVEGMCVSYEKNGVSYGVESYASKTGENSYRLSYYGADVITVLISAVLDVLRIGDNSTLIDNAVALLSGKSASELDITASGVAALLTELFEDGENAGFVSPNWDYLLEGRYVYKTDSDGNTVSELWEDGDYTSLAQYSDLSVYHSVKNLEYLTNWTYSSASTADETISNLADYLAVMIDDNAEDFTSFFTDVVNNQLFSGELFSDIAALTAGVFNSFSAETIAMFDAVLDTDMTSWLEDGYIRYREAGIDLGDGITYPYSTYEKNPDCPLWDPSSPEYINTRDEFMSALKELLNPLGNLLGVLFLEDDYRFFHTIADGMDDLPANDTADGDSLHYGDDAIVLDGLDLYGHVLVPLFELFGVDMSGYTTAKYVSTENGLTVCNTELFVSDFVDMLNELLDTIIAKDPVNWIMDLLPNIIYFINAGGFNACFANLISGIDKVIAAVNTYLGEDNQIDLDSLLGGFDPSDLSFSALFSLLYEKTGIFVSPELNAFISTLYVGSIEYYQSANGQGAFRMTLSDEEDRADLITIILSLLVEIVMDEGTFTASDGTEITYDNGMAIEDLLSVYGTSLSVDAILNILKNPSSVIYKDINWNYFDGTVDEDGNITAPVTPFTNYLTYATDWTKSKADYLYDNLDAILTMVLGAVTGQKQTVADILGGTANFYTGENLNKTIEYIKTTLGSADGNVLAAIAAFLNVDFSAWQNMEPFAEGEIYDRATFISAVTQLLEPVYPLLNWLFFGKSYEYFVAQVPDESTPEGENEVLITIPGSEGYKNGLVPLLEAFGVVLPEITAENSSCEASVQSVLNALYERVDEFLADPVNELLETLPNVLYFINANGMGVAVRNIFAGVFTIVDVLGEAGIENFDVKSLLGFDIEKLDIAGIFGMLEQKIPALAGIELNAPFCGSYEIAEDGTVTFIQDASGENILEKFYLGTAEKFISSNGAVAYRMNTTEENRGDLLTMLFSVALETVLYGDNSKVFDAAAGLTEGTIGTVAALLTSETDFEMSKADWVYFLGLEGEERAAAVDAALASQLNELPALPERTLHYLEYDNNWNEETAEYLVTNLPSLVDTLVSVLTDSDTLQEFISGSLNLYSDATVDLIVGTVADKIKTMDATMLSALDAMLDVDLDAFINFKSAGVTNRLTFVLTLSKAFGYLGRLLDWVLFDREYTFFTHLSDGTTPTIVVNGSEGYKYGVAPLLAAIGVETDLGEIPSASESYSITEQVLPTLLDNICKRIDGILADPINEVTDLLLAASYFINANGVSVCMSNLTAPVNALLQTISEKTGKDITLAAFMGFDPAKLDLEGISELIKSKTGLDIYSAVGAYYENFYFGQLEYYKAYKDVGAFRMVYSETEQRHDFVTILLSVVFDVLTYEGNRDALINILGENGLSVYNVLMAFLCDCEAEVPMQNFSWRLTDYADSGTALSPVVLGSIYEYMYGKFYTREMGVYMTKHLEDFIDVWVTLLGIRKPDGTTFSGLEELLNSYLGSTVYRTDILESVLSVLKNFTSTLKNGVGETLYNHLAAVLSSSLGADITYWDSFTVNAIADGDRAGFTSEILRMLQPVYPILSWLLTDTDFSFFNKDDGVDGSVSADDNDYIILHGAEGYAYSVIPVMEALGLHDATLTPTEYKAAVSENKDALITSIINPVFDVLDAVAANPFDTLLGMLPGIIYFVNSNGLDTAFKNLINAGLRILETIEPLTGEIDLYDKLGFSFDVNFTGIMEKLLGSFEESTGFKLTETAMEAMIELTVGEVVSFTSKNGETAYTMKYLGESNEVDQVTVLLRMLLTFISVDQNVKVIEQLLKPKLEEDSYAFVSTMLENFSEMARDKDGMDKIMYTVYYTFYSTYVAGASTLNWRDNFNGDYSYLSNLFATSDVSFLRDIGSGINKFLDIYNKDIFDSDGIAPNGLIAFFQKIAKMFRMIIDFFKNLV